MGLLYDEYMKAKGPERVAVYGATRNIYEKLRPSIKSLTENTRMDRIWILIEDDALPFEIPENARVLNVSGQVYFRKGGPNYNHRWTWMVLMKTAMTKILPEEKRVLWLDADTIIFQDIGDLFETDIRGKYIGGAIETLKTGATGRTYVNAGVLYMNLEELRDGTDDKIINVLNEKYYPYPEQDVLNEVCQGKIMRIPAAYNVNAFTEKTEITKIRHYAAEPGWFDYPEVKKYREDGDGKQGV